MQRIAGVATTSQNVKSVKSSHFRKRRPAKQWKVEVLPSQSAGSDHEGVLGLSERNRLATDLWVRNHPRFLISLIVF